MKKNWERSPENETKRKKYNIPTKNDAKRRKDINSLF